MELPFHYAAWIYAGLHRNDPKAPGLSALFFLSGDCLVAKRGDSSSDRAGYGSIDRFLMKGLQKITDLKIRSRVSETSGLRPRQILLGTSTAIYNPAMSEPVLLDPKELTNHCYSVGKSGLGKTMNLLVLLLGLAMCSLGFVSIDIHGDLSQMVIEQLASRVRTRRDFELLADQLVILDFFDPEHAPILNPLHASYRHASYQLPLEMLVALKRAYPDIQMGARTEELLRNSLFTLSQARRALINLPSILTDSGYREQVVSELRDQELRNYWSERFEPLSERMKAMYVEPVLNKVTMFTSDPFVRHIIALPESLVDFRCLMDQGKWVVISLNKGASSENAKLLGSLCTSNITSAAFSRSDIPEYQRVRSHLIVDEFQNFMGLNFEQILSEARKYGLSLIMAHQNLTQLDRPMLDSIFGNVGTSFFFKLGHRDAFEVSRGFRESEQGIIRNTLTSLDVGEVLLRTKDNRFRKVKVQHIERSPVDSQVIEQLRQASRAKYCRRRIDIDRTLQNLRERIVVRSVPEAQADRIDASLPLARIQIVQSNSVARNQDIIEGEL